MWQAISVISRKINYLDCSTVSPTQGVVLNGSHLSLSLALESSQIKLPLSPPREEGVASGGQVVSWDLSCAVWAYSESGGGRLIHVSCSQNACLYSSPFPHTIYRSPLSSQRHWLSECSHCSSPAQYECGWCAFAHSSVGVVVFCDCPTTDGADFLSDLMTQHVLDRATGTTSPPPLTHSHLHQVHS